MIPEPGLSQGSPRSPASYSATSYLSEGTISFRSEAGTARYVGEYLVSGKFGETMQLHVKPPNAEAAQAELKTFGNVEAALVGTEAKTATYTCEGKETSGGNQTCKWKTAVVKGS